MVCTYLKDLSVAVLSFIDETVETQGSVQMKHALYMSQRPKQYNTLGTYLFKKKKDLNYREHKLLTTKWRYLAIKRLHREYYS